MLATIDRAAPPLRASEVIARARVRSGRRSALLAAAAVIMVASVATATVPGSIVRRYLQGIFGDHTMVVTPSRAGDATAADAASRGIAFAPGAEVSVDFSAGQSSGTLEVRSGNVSSVTLAQSGASGEAHYALTPTGVIIRNEGSTASYALVLPRTVVNTRVRIAGRVVFSRHGDRVSCTGIRVEAKGCVIKVAAERSPAAHGTP